MKMKRKKLVPIWWEYKTNGVKALIIILSAVPFLGLFYHLANYKNERYIVDKLKYAKISLIEQILKEELNNRSFFVIDTDYLEKKIKASSSYIEKVTVNKSLYNGVIVKIVEYEPQVIVKTIDGKSYFITNDKKIIKIDPENDILMGIPELNYISPNINDTNFPKYALLAKYLIEKLDRQLFGSFNFDNFGNFFILLEGNRIIRYDLSERFFSLDDQLKLMYEAIRENPRFKEIDLQFSYLVIK